MRKIIKMGVLNLGIVFLDILLFSEGLLHIELGGASVFETAFGLTAILMSIVFFGVGNYKIMFEKPVVIRAGEIKTVEDCVGALRQNQVKKTFSKEIDYILEQIERFIKKQETIKDILLQKFEIGEMSYSKFQGTILDVEGVFYRNIRSILNKINAFDEADYLRVKQDQLQKNFSEEFLQTKISLFNEYIHFVKEAVEDNEEILLKLDKLLLEITKFNSLEDGEIEQMSAMKEIDELINKAKFYK